MVKFFVNIVLIVTILSGNIGSTPQLDLPLDNNSSHVRKRVFDDQGLNRFRTNGHANKVVEPVVSGGDQSNEVVIGDAQNYDHDRSQRYGPPYNEENDRRFYNDNFNPRYGQQNSGYRDEERNNEDRYHNGNDDDDDKYYAGPRPRNNEYYISEKQRNLYGYRDYYSVVCQIFEEKSNNSMHFVKIQSSKTQNSIQPEFYEYFKFSYISTIKRSIFFSSRQ